MKNTSEIEALPLDARGRRMLVRRLWYLAGRCEQALLTILRPFESFSYRCEQQLRISEGT
jgi:hypothetical protein